MIRESTEETVFLTTGSPGTLNDGVAEVDIAMGNFTRFDFLVGLVISWSQSTPGSKVVCRFELTHIRSDLCDQLCCGTFLDSWNFLQAFEFLWKMLLAYLQHSLLTFVSVALGDANLLMELAQYIYFCLGDNACQ